MVSSANAVQLKLLIDVHEGSVDGAIDGDAEGLGKNRTAVLLGCKLTDGSRVGTEDGSDDGLFVVGWRVGPSLSVGDALGLGDSLGIALGSFLIGI